MPHLAEKKHCWTRVFDLEIIRLVKIFRFLYLTLILNLNKFKN
jgi:hypothetical protein